MFVSIRDARSSKADRHWIEESYKEYLDDLTRVSLNTGMFPAFGMGDSASEFGDRQPDIMARWFADDSSYPLLILRDQEPQGFALVSKPTMKRSDVDYRMAEFFVVKRSRRHGVGREAAELIFNRFDGRWEIVEFMRNQAAVAFWRNIVGQYTHGRFNEAVLQGEVRHTFRSEPTHSRVKAL
jgi:predicted acetyltransferase